MNPVHLQAVRNLALLARQALSNNFTTMPVDPKQVADAALAFESAVGRADTEEACDPSEAVYTVIRDANGRPRSTLTPKNEVAKVLGPASLDSVQVDPFGAGVPAPIKPS